MKSYLDSYSNVNDSEIVEKEIDSFSEIPKQIHSTNAKFR